MFGRFLFPFVALVIFLAGCSQKTKDQLYLEGMKQLKGANPTAAIVLFKSALEKDPNFSDARYQLAHAYTATGNSDQAAKEFLKLLQQDPKRPELQLELARAYCASRKIELAMREAQSHLEKYPGSAEALELLGIASAINRDFGQAEAYLRQAMKADSARMSARLELAVLFNQMERQQEARRLLNEVVAQDPKNLRARYMLAELEISSGKSDKAFELYRSIIGISGNELLARYRLGLLHLFKGDSAAAERIAAELAGNFPKRPEGARLKGVLQYQRQAYRDAIVDLQNSLSIAPTPEASYYLGLCQYSLGDLETALSNFRKVLENNPSSSHARMMIGMILLQQRRVDDAVAELTKIMGQNPQDALAHNLLGSAYIAKGMYEEGMREFNLAISLDGRLVDAYLKKGLVHLGKGNEKGAEIALQTAVKVAPEVLNSRMLLVSLYLRQNNYGKAIDLLTQGLTGGKGDAPLYNYLAGIRFAQGKPEEGLGYLNKAKEHDPAYLPAYFSSAVYHAAKGEHGNALEQLTRILELEPHHTMALLNMADLLALKGSDQAALSYYMKATETNNNVAFMALANYYAKKGDRNKALSVLDDAIRKVPRNAAAMEQKGKLLVAGRKYREALELFSDLADIDQEAGARLRAAAYLEMNDPVRAEEECRRIMLLKPKSAYGHMLLATVLDARKDHRKALEVMQTGLRLEPESTHGLLTLGRLQAKVNDKRAAMETYARALKIDPRFAPALYAQGELLEQEGRTKEAIKKYREVLSIDPNYVPALNNLAYHCINGHGSKREGLRLAFAAFRLESASPVIMDTLGYALLLNGNASDARKLLEQTAIQLPENPTVLYHLALALSELGMREQSERLLRRSLTLGPFSEAAAARTLLSRDKK